jgi:hypothetical protein
MGDRQIGYDVDGSPFGEAFYEQAGAQARERQFREDMARCKARWDAGDLTAAARATHVCIVRRVPDLGIDADWLIDAVRKLTVSAMSEQEKRDRRAWAGHLEKWEALVELLERGDELFARKPAPGEPRDDRGTSMERARAAVSEMLKKRNPAAIPRPPSRRRMRSSTRPAARTRRLNVTRRSSTRESKKS